MEAILIHSYPLPPSENKIYANVPGVGRVATKELKNYRKECIDYALKNHTMFKEVHRMRISEWKEFDHFKVDYFFTFKRERLYNKQGGIKKLDVANRIKACQDCLFASLGMDDKVVWASSVEKMCGENEGVHIIIHPHTPISAIELMEMFQDRPEATKLFS